jgi:hypothetical protein
MKSPKKPKMSDDPRWEKYDELRKVGDILKADKLKEEIKDAYTWKKPCHHVGEK